MIGETVTIIGTDVDGNTEVYDNETVDVNSINISTETKYNYVKKARIGLRYTYILKPMRMDVMTQTGTTKGSIGRFAEVVISFFKTLGAKYGKDTDSLHTISELPTTGSELYTGDVVVTTDGGFGVEDDFVISGDDPLPCVVRAIIPRKAKTGR